MKDTFERNQDIEAAGLDDETILVNPITSKFFVLNSTSSFIWELLSNPCTAVCLATEISKNYTGITLEDALSDVQEATQEMVLEDLIFCNNS
jgi:hypothetical protein